VEIAGASIANAVLTVEIEWEGEDEKTFGGDFSNSALFDCKNALQYSTFYLRCHRKNQQEQRNRKKKRFSMAAKFSRETLMKLFLHD
jgi:hypothetical protein